MTVHSTRIGGSRQGLRRGRRADHRASGDAVTDRGACAGQVDVQSTAQVRMAIHTVRLPH
ncbi:hypothetical protein C2142_14010 [Streptomyces sp. CB01881]|nr:hypothetical protein C2142_14010 [Streptomyces sp. CB01881]